MNSKLFNTVHIHFKVLAIVLDLLHVHFEDGSRTTTVQSPLDTAKIWIRGRFGIENKLERSPWILPLQTISFLYLCFQMLYRSITCSNFSKHVCDGFCFSTSEQFHQRPNFSYSFEVIWTKIASSTKLKALSLRHSSLSLSFGEEGLLFGRKLISGWMTSQRFKHQLLEKFELEQLIM